MSGTGSAALVGASAAASYNMIFQLAFRALTFGINAFTLRFVTKDVLGVVNVRLMLIYTTIMTLCQEPYRRASLSKSSEDARLHWRKVVNLFWISFPLVILMASGVSVSWMYLLSEPDDAAMMMTTPTTPKVNSTSLTSPYAIAIVAYAVSAVIDVASSPLLVVSQAYFFSRLKVAAESLAVLTRALIIVLLLPHPDYRHWGLHIFSLAQLAFACVKTGTFYGYFLWLVLTSRYRNEKHSANTSTDEDRSKTKDDSKDADFPFQSLRDFFPSATAPSRAPSSSSSLSSSSSPLPLVDPTLSSLSWTFFKQTIVKQLLTEGERYVMTFFDALSFADQGVYDVVNNVGSLVVRFLFQPIEESSNVFFSRTLKRGGEEATEATKSTERTVEDDVKKRRLAEENLATQVFRYLLRVVVHLGCFALVFGQSYAHLALHLLGGSTLSEGVGPDLLRAYCFYVLVIAVNGTLEAFVTAVMTESQVEAYSRFMVACSAAFVAATLGLTSFFGSFGFILANCLNMALRIAYCVKFVVDYYAGKKVHEAPAHPLFGLRPPALTLIAYFVSFLITKISELIIYDLTFARATAHVGVGAITCVGTLALVAYAEREMIRFAKKNWDERKNA